MKVLILILIGLLVVGCGEKGERLLPPEPPKAAPEKLIANLIVEKAIREELKKPTGELTKADFEKVNILELKALNSNQAQLTELPLLELEKLTNLEHLYIGDNQLTSVEGLEKCTQLWNLDLNSNQLTELSKGLEKLTQLRWLRLDHNQLTDVKGLEKLTQLTTLRLDSNKLTDVKGLEKLDQLKQLYIQNNPDLTKAQIAELKKALPKCEIVSNPTK